MQVDKEFLPYWDENLSEEDYHSNKSAVNSNSLKAILKSPASFKAAFWGQAKETDAMKLGRLIHKAVLEGAEFLKRYVVQPDFGNLRTKAAREERDLWIVNQTSSGNIIISQSERDMIVGICESIMSHKFAAEMLKNGKTEISGFFPDEKTGIVNRIRPDFLSFDGSVLLDVKSTTDCTAESFSKAIWNYRYDFQLAMYMAGCKTINGKAPDFGVFIAVEKTEPYEVAVYTADEALLEKGQIDYRKALDRLDAALKSDKWDKYQQTIQNISLPYWALQE